LRERDGVHLLMVTGRLPLRSAGCQAGALDRVIVAAAEDRAAVLREGNGGDVEIVARHHPTRGFGPEVVKPYLLSDPAGARLAVGFESERPQAPRFGDGPLELAGGNVPEFPLALATRVAPRKISRITPAVVGPIAAAAGDRLAIGREGEGTNPIAVPFQRPSQ